MGGATYQCAETTDACLLANYFIASLINHQSDTLIIIIV